MIYNLYSQAISFISQFILCVACILIDSYVYFSIIATSVQLLALVQYITILLMFYILLAHSCT